MVVQQVELLRLVSTTGAATARGLTVAALLRLPLVLLAAGLAVFLPLLAFARVCVVCALAVFFLAASAGAASDRLTRAAMAGTAGGKSEGALPAPETSERGACPIRTVTATHWGHTAYRQFMRRTGAVLRLLGVVRRGMWRNAASRPERTVRSPATR